MCIECYLKADKVVCSLFPNGFEWNLLEDLVAILKPFEEIINDMSGSKYPTICMTSPLLCQVCEVT